MQSGLAKNQKVLGFDHLFLRGAKFNNETTEVWLRGVPPGSVFSSEAAQLGAKMSQIRHARDNFRPYRGYHRHEGPTLTSEPF